MKFINDHTGTAMVDAAIVMPLVLLAVMAMIYLLINIYSTVSLQAHMHLLLREKSGIKSDMIRCEINDSYQRDKIRKKAEAAKIEIHEKKGLLVRYVEASRDSVYVTNSLIEDPPDKISYGRSYIFKEPDIIRYKEIIIGG